MKMEKKQNVKPTTIEDQIDQLWASNSHIPFMQSKEILAYGYREGRKSIDANACKLNETFESVKEDKQSFTGTTKELIEHTDKEVKKRNQELDRDSKTYIRLEVYNEILTYMKNHDLIDCYNEFKSRQEQLHLQLPAGYFNKRKRSNREK